MYAAFVRVCVYIYMCMYMYIYMVSVDYHFYSSLYKKISSEKSHK